MNIKYIFLAICIFTSGCTFTNRNSTLHRLNIEADGKKREYILYIPKGLPSNSPLLIALHGYTDNAEVFMNYTGLTGLPIKMALQSAILKGLLIVPEIPSGR
jgi:poly(3-hydroxybutyrate) depolymerase